VTTVRIGTRGSDLALWQAHWVAARLREAHPRLDVETVVVRTRGDTESEAPFGATWPVGAFVTAVERALLEGRVDLAVHSYKDVPTQETDGLAVAATPVRGPVHDVLLTRGALTLEELPPGARIGTSSPRRAAQMLQAGDFRIVPLRGNVPTRVATLEREELDGIVLAAAGLDRLGIRHPFRIDLPVGRFVPAPAQGALAVQVRTGSPEAALAAALDDPDTRRAVEAERHLLHVVEAGCHAPVGALAVVDANALTLEAQIFSEDLARMVAGSESGSDPAEVATRLGKRLLATLEASG